MADPKERKSKSSHGGDKLPGDVRRAVIVFADIIDCSEISNNKNVEEYAYILHEFHEAAKSALFILEKAQYKKSQYEFSTRGDEACLILHSGESEEDIKFLPSDASAALVFGIAVKLMWRASEYNQDRILHGLMPRDVAVGINEGAVFVSETDLYGERRFSSEGYAINLAKRIEGESRNGSFSRIMVSSGVKYLNDQYLDKANFLVFKMHKTEKLKGLSTHQGLFELKNIENDAAQIFKELLDKCEFSPECWGKMEFKKKSEPKDFWNVKMFNFKNAVQEKPGAQIYPSSSRPAESDADKEISSLLSEADMLFYSGNYGKAAEKYSEIVKTIKDDPYIYIRLGYSLGAIGNHEQALAAYDRAIELKSDLSYSHNNRGLELEELGRSQDAIAAYNQAILLEPGQYYAYTNRATALVSLKKYEEAIESCDISIQLNPDFVVAYNNRGVALERLEKYSDAIIEYDKAIWLNPDYPTAHDNRGVALARLEKYEEALASHDRAIALKPDYVSAYMNKSELLIVLDRAEEARETIHKAAELKLSDRQRTIFEFLSCLADILLTKPPYDVTLDKFKSMRGTIEIKNWNYGLIEKFLESGKLTPKRAEAFRQAIGIMKNPAAD